MEKLKENLLSIGVVLTAIVVVLLISNREPQMNLGNVNIGNDYQTTTTLANVGGTGMYVQTRPGALGSVTVVSTTIGQFELIDADGTSTSTLFKTEVSLPEGTYTFDRGLRYGLVVSTTANYNGVFVTSYR